jgi:hypothetical protein
VDDDATAGLREYAAIAIGREHGLDPVASSRLVGDTVDELRRDAASYRAGLLRLGISDRIGCRSTQRISTQPARRTRGPPSG